MVTRLKPAAEMLDSSIVDAYESDWNEAEVSFDSEDGAVINQFLESDPNRSQELDSTEHFIFGCWSEAAPHGDTAEARRRDVGQQHR